MSDSRFSRVISVLTAPAKTFQAIAERPTFVVPLILLALLGAAVTNVTFTKVDPADFVRQMEERGQQVPPNMSGDMFLTFARWGGTVGALVIGPLTYLIVALLFMVLLRLLGSEIDFVRSLSVTAHGFVPFGLAALIGIPVALARDSISLEDAQGGQFLQSNLGVLAGEDAGHIVKALLSSVDVFSIWCIVLLAIGYRIVGKVSKGAAWGAVLAIWLVGVVIKVGMTAIFMK